MSRTQRVVGPLRLLLVTVFVALVAAQVVVLPGAFARMAEQSDDLAPLRWPLLAGAALGLLVVVLRTLLRQATTLRTDLDGVI